MSTPEQPQPQQNIKSIVVTGDAAKTGGAKRRRRTAKRPHQEGGARELDTGPAPVPTQTANVIKQMNSAQTPPGTAPPAQPQKGGAPVSKVSLVPAKNKNKTRVLLAPKAAGPTTPQAGGAKTRKQKKLSLRVANIRRKVASTRKHIHASTSLPIDKVRKELVDAKLLNPASKAPEALIRKIYADYKITTNKS